MTIKIHPFRAIAFKVKSPITSNVTDFFWSAGVLTKRCRGMGKASGFQKRGAHDQSDRKRSDERISPRECLPPERPSGAQSAARHETFR